MICNVGCLLKGYYRTVVCIICLRAIVSPLQPRGIEKWSHSMFTRLRVSNRFLSWVRLGAISSLQAILSNVTKWLERCNAMIGSIIGTPTQTSHQGLMVPFALAMKKGQFDLTVLRQTSLQNPCSRNRSERGGENWLGLENCL